MRKLIRNDHRRYPKPNTIISKNTRHLTAGVSITGTPRTAMSASHVRRLQARNPVRETTLPPEDIVPAPHILITGGIGDFLVLESHMEPERRAAVQHVTLATRAYKGIQELLEAYSCFPNLNATSIVQNNWEKRFCFTHKDELSSLEIPELSIESAQDWSIMVRFPFIERGVLKYHKSSYVANSIADISRFELPSRYIVCNPYSPNDRRCDRDFSETDWKYAIGIAQANDMPLVVVNVSDDYIPNAPPVINLNRMTSLPESIEIVKGSCRYIGIDSCLSIVAAQSLSAENIKIKSNNKHLYTYKSIYYAPLKSASFIMESF